MVPSAVQKRLAIYRSKRDFATTPEPSGETPLAPLAAPRFVVQMHHASHLHYDFRLEIDGVLKSWAVPKGPTLAPLERHLAMQTEDHPLGYFDFEGIIPAGYGAGNVIVWDAGTFEIADGEDASRQLRKGRLKFVLHGEKLNGLFTLVKMKGRGGPRDNAWLLFKDHDAHAVPGWSPTGAPQSVLTGRTLDDVANDPASRTWQSKGAPSKGEPPAPPPSAKRVRRSKRFAPPPFDGCMLATLLDTALDDPAWLFEVKWDGFRAVCDVNDQGDVVLVSRNGNNLLPRFPELAGLAAAFTEKGIRTDGEIVTFNAKGQSSFQGLQRRLLADKAKGDPAPVVYCVFDCLYARGEDLRDRPLEERKAVLRELVKAHPSVLYSDHVVGKGKELYALAKKEGLEGIVGKRRDSAYTAKRSRDWVKVKVAHAIECVIVGYTLPNGKRPGLGALVLGLRAKRGAPLEFVGGVGTGFDQKTLVLLRQKLDAIRSDRCPFAVRPPSTSRAVWVEPKLVASVGYSEFTDGGQLRHPVFLGLRPDKAPAECVRERPLHAETLKKKPSAQKPAKKQATQRKPSGGGP